MTAAEMLEISRRIRLAADVDLSEVGAEDAASLAESVEDLLALAATMPPSDASLYTDISGATYVYVRATKRSASGARAIAAALLVLADQAEAMERASAQASLPGIGGSP